MSTENKTENKTELIERRIDKVETAKTGFTPTGAIAFNSMNQIMEFAKVMAVAGIAIPKHLRESPGACMAVAIQASEWQMTPFAVANKSYVVNDRIAYEAQLVNAVILRRAPIVGRMKITYSGQNGTRRCKVVARLNDGDEVEYESPEFDKITPKNSPLWKADPDQQLFYYSSRAMCRRHFPDVLLGIYTVDELEDSRSERPVTGREVPAAKVPDLGGMLLPSAPAPAADLTLSADEPSPVEVFWSRVQSAGLNRDAVEEYIKDQGVITDAKNFTDEIAAGLMRGAAFDAIVTELKGGAK